jgi:DNA end-binding protein Ku
MALFTLRAAEEVRAAQFGIAEGESDAEMVAIAKAIIAQRTASFDPSAYRDRYQEALRQLIEAKMKGLPIKPEAVSAPSPVIDLVALKRSLAQEPSAPEQRTAKRKQTKQASDRRPPALLLPLTGARKRNQRPSADPAVASIKKGIASIKKRK